MPSTRDTEDLLEPTKFNPCMMEDSGQSLSRYDSIAKRNPYETTPSFRDCLKDRETHGPEVNFRSVSDKNVSFDHKHMWILPSPTAHAHPCFRSHRVEDMQNSPSPRDGAVKSVKFDQSLPSLRHKRSQSQPLSPFDGYPPQSPTKQGRGLMKSFSDNHFYSPKTQDVYKERKNIPPPLNLTTKDSEYQRLPSIQENENYALNYKVQVRQGPENEETIVRSPLKRLFGEGGLLGRSASGKDLTSSSSRKNSLANLGGRVKRLAEEIGKEFSDKFAFVVSASQGSSWIKTSTFPVSVSPYVQADFYMQLELLLNLATNDFLMREYRGNRLSVSSVKTVVEEWAKKGRPQVLAFRFDLITQRELAQLNCDTLQFGGINRFNKLKIVAVLAAWKTLAREMSVRTFCQPDSVVKKHLHDAEKVLELIDVSADSMLAFHDLRDRVLLEMFRTEHPGSF